MTDLAEARVPYPDDHLIHSYNLLNTLSAETDELDRASLKAFQQHGRDSQQHKEAHDVYFRVYRQKERIEHAILRHKPSGFVETAIMLIVSYGYAGRLEGDVAEAVSVRRAIGHILGLFIGSRMITELEPGAYAEAIDLDLLTPKEDGRAA